LAPDLGRVEDWDIGEEPADVVEPGRSPFDDGAGEDVTADDLLAGVLGATPFNLGALMVGVLGFALGDAGTEV